MRVFSYAIESDKFYVEIPSGCPVALVADNQGFVDAETIERMIDLLTNTLELMNSDGQDQAEILADCERSKNVGLLEPSRWIFPKKKGSGYRLGHIGQCVYFVYSPKNDGIKIGITHNMTRRLWGIARLSGDKRESLKVIALIPCHDPRRLEAYIHDQLHRSCLYGEWFQPGPVLDFIAQHSGERPVLA